jgi:hypothetical protein
VEEHRPRRNAEVADMIRSRRSRTIGHLEPLVNSLLWTLVVRFVPTAVLFDEGDPLLTGGPSGRLGGHSPGAP